MVTTLLTVLALTSGTQVQEPQWQAFEGCWQPAEDASAPVMCMRQEGAGVLMSTYVGGELKSEQRIDASGVARPISEGGCGGQETGRWSDDAARVYLRATLSCGTGLERTTTSVLALLSPESLVEVQSLQVGEGTTVRSVRYEAVAERDFPAGFQLGSGRELARETARLQVAAALDLDDVVEASKQLDPGALEALLALRQSGFALSGSKLKELADAGVARSTIDVIVGLSYPQKFRVAQAEPDEEREREWARYGYDPSYRNDCMGLSYYSSMYCDFRYGYYGYGPYGYSRYGGSYDGYYGGGYWGGGPIIVVPGDGSETPAPGGTVGPNGRSRSGEATRGTARRRTEPTGNIVPRSNVGSSSSGSTAGGSSVRSGSGSNGSGSSGSGSVSSGGYSRGSGSTSSGTAKPRN